MGNLILKNNKVEDFSHKFCGSSSPNLRTNSVEKGEFIERIRSQVTKLQKSHLEKMQNPNFEPLNMSLVVLGSQGERADTPRDQFSAPPQGSVLHGLQAAEGSENDDQNEATEIDLRDSAVPPRPEPMRGEGKMVAAVGNLIPAAQGAENEVRSYIFETDLIRRAREQNLELMEMMRRREEEGDGHSDLGVEDRKEPPRNLGQIRGRPIDSPTGGIG